MQTFPVPLDIEAKLKFYQARGLSGIALSPTMLDRQDREVAKLYSKCFAQTIFLKNVPFEQIKGAVTEYRSAFERCPTEDNSGGANFTTGLGLFLIARLLDPQLIVEAGSFQGVGTYFLKCGAPQAEVFGIDVDISRIKYSVPGIYFRQVKESWTEISLPEVPASKKLIYFDDHKSQLDRIIQARNRGFRVMLFDDSAPIYSMNSAGWAPIPTLDMILDNELQIGEKYHWAVNQTLFEYEHTAEISALCDEVRPLIKTCFELPDLINQVGWARNSVQKYVEIVG